MKNVNTLRRRSHKLSSEEHNETTRTMTEEATDEVIYQECSFCLERLQTRDIELMFQA